MRYTVQTHSNSGSFASPDGKRSLYRVNSKREAADILLDWADEHPRIGSDERDAYAMVWIGHFYDVTDCYPDFELTLGPKLGVRWANC